MTCGHCVGAVTAELEQATAALDEAGNCQLAAN
jgi:hypothetical protein